MMVGEFYFFSFRMKKVTSKWSRVRFEEGRVVRLRGEDVPPYREHGPNLNLKINNLSF